MDEEVQPDGYYPRLNGSMMKTGNFVGKIVSVVGHFENNASFRCSDGQPIQISTEHLPDPDATTGQTQSAVEVVGQVSSPDLLVVFVVRVLSQDMDVSVYNRMLAVRNKPNYEEYFSPFVM